MNIDQAADLFEGVRWRGTQQFTALCPAHQDKSPSLSVREGHTNLMVKCFAGCTFFEVAAAVGLDSMAFKIGGGNRVAPTGLPARTRLRQLLRRPELVTLEDVATLALHPVSAQSTRAAERYPDLMDMPYLEAMRFHTSVMNGPVFELLWDGVVPRVGFTAKHYPRYETEDWYEARDKATKEMAETWRKR
jgi:hypothetical protein